MPDVRSCCRPRHVLSRGLGDVPPRTRGRAQLANNPLPHISPLMQNGPIFSISFRLIHADDSASDSIESNEVTSPELSSSGEPPATVASLPKQFLHVLGYVLASGGSSPRVLY